MKRIIGSLVVGILCVSAGIGAQQTDTLLVKNTGLILDTPFLHQTELPYESEFLGAYGDELVTYEYGAEGMPTSVVYVDIFEFSDYARTGPTLATMMTGEGITAEIRLSYDETGRLVEVEEDNAFGEGLFRQERYAWTGEGVASLPYAIEVRYPLDSEVERYRYLYDAAGRLQGLDGVNVLESDPGDRASVSEWYSYRSRTLDEIFGRIEPTSTETQSTALR